MTVQADQKSRDLGNKTVPCVVIPSIQRKGMMSSMGFSTAIAKVNLREDSSYIHNVFMAILEPSVAKLTESLAVLIFFKNASEAEMMMADSSDFPNFSGKADITVVRIVRKGNMVLRTRPEELRSCICSDVREASGKTVNLNGPILSADQKENGSPALSASISPQDPVPRNLRASALSYVPRRENSPPVQSQGIQKSRKEGKGGKPRRQPPPNQFKCSVFVSHIVPGATWHDLQSAFSTQVAPTLRVYMKPGCSWAHVYFYDLKGVERAIEAAAAGLIKICGRPARVRRRTRKKKMKRNSNTSPPSGGMPAPQQHGPRKNVRDIKDIQGIFAPAAKHTQHFVRKAEAGPWGGKPSSGTSLFSNFMPRNDAGIQQQRDFTLYNAWKKPVKQEARSKRNETDQTDALTWRMGRNWFPTEGQEQSQGFGRTTFGLRFFERPQTSLSL